MEQRESRPSSTTRLGSSSSYRDLASLRSLLGTMEAPDAADLLGELDPADRVVLFRLFPRPVSAAVFAELDAESERVLASQLTDDEARRILAELAPDTRTQLLAELPGLLVQRLLSLLPPDELAEARTLLGYPEKSVGRLTTPDLRRVKSD